MSEIQGKDTVEDGRRDKANGVEVTSTEKEVTVQNKNSLKKKRLSRKRSSKESSVCKVSEDTDIEFKSPQPKMRQTRTRGKRVTETTGKTQTGSEKPVKTDPVSTPLVPVNTAAEASSYTTPQMDEAIQLLTRTEANKAPQKRRQNQEVTTTEEKLKALTAGRRVTRSLLAARSADVLYSHEGLDKNSGRNSNLGDTSNTSVETDNNNNIMSDQRVSKPAARKQVDNKSSEMKQKTDKTSMKSPPQPNPYGDASQNEGNLKTENEVESVDSELECNSDFKGDSERKVEGNKPVVVEHESTYDDDIREYKDSSSSQASSDELSMVSSCTERFSAVSVVYSPASGQSSQLHLRSLKKVSKKIA